MTTSIATAEILRDQVERYGAAIVASARVADTDGEHAVRVTLRDGFTFLLPADFSMDHFDRLIAIVMAAKIFGREQALLELSPDADPH